MSRKTTNQEWLCIVKEEMLKCNSVTSSKRKFILHPLIHTRSKSTLAQNVVNIKKWSQ